MKPVEEKAAQKFLMHHDFVRGQALRYAPVPDLVDDIAHQVFLEFLAKADRWTLDEDVRPILVTLVKGFAHRAIQERKKTAPKALAELIDKMLSAVSSGETANEYESAKIALKACMQRLGDRQRKIVVEHYFDDRSLAEIAEPLHISANGVSHALCRIREALKKCIRRSLGGQPDL